MSTAKKLDDVELQNIIGYEKKYFATSQQYGECLYQINILNKHLKSIESQLDDLEIQKEAIIKELLTKHGNGRVDLETGHFVSE